MTNQLTILLTNIWLAEFAGSEVVVRDLALGLLRRGHRPIVYSPTLGRASDEIGKRGIPVIDDLRKLREEPDIIHAHHSIPCGEAIIRFPDVPVVFACHNFTHWVEAPVHFPQIGAYVAVDYACRDRLVQLEGIDPQCVVLLHNAVDLRRIPPRLHPLRERPRRAIAFGKASAVPELRLACEQLGIEYYALGIPIGHTVSHPELELVNFDLAFASARSALEALCCGCAVIVCDHRGFGGLVTLQNFESLRANNFGLRSLTEAMTVDRCVQEIGRYDAADARLVTERARRDADIEDLLDAFEKLYVKVLTAARRLRITPDAHERAVARFLHENLPRRPGDDRWPWIAEREDMQRQCQCLELKASELSAELVAEREGKGRQCQHWESKISELSAELADLKRSRLLKLGRLLRRLVGAPIRY
jgi:hypothetical protein